MQEGDRVGAMLGGDDKVVRFLGYGVYLGRHVPEPGVYLMGMIDMHAEGRDNPTILLDSGRKVYGCECWWGPEAVVKKKIEHFLAQGAKLVETSIDEFRAESKAAFEEKPQS